MAEKGEKDYGKRFVNPYNFIPLMEKCERALPAVKEDDSYTGYFDCGLEILTPLFIPNTSASRLLRKSEKEDSRSQEENWKGYDFFSYDDWSEEDSYKNWPPPPPVNPVIPGSELRGAARSVYEAAFNGCLSSVSADRQLSRRTNEAKQPGILKKVNGEWIIEPCKKAMLYVESEKSKNSDKDWGIFVPEAAYNQWKEGQEIWIKLKNENYMKRIKGKDIPIGTLIERYEIIEDNNEFYENKRKELRKKGYEQGWLHKGEAFDRKHHESVFYTVKNNKEEIIKLEYASDIDRLDKIVKDYRDDKKNRLKDKAHGGYSAYKISHKGTLVYYSKTTDGHVYLSPACIGREIFTKTIGNLLKNNGGYEPCTGPELCPACQIFGMVDKNGEFAYGSKVRVTDAVLIHPEQDSRALFEEKPIILPELGEPRPGAVEFYTKTPYTSKDKPASGNGYWTYDYKYKYKSDEDKIEERCFLEENQPAIRGRKFYWHSDVNLNKYKETQDYTVNAMKQRIRPMKAQASRTEPLFHFRVYFDQLSKKQLSQLKWALDFGNSNCAHKIGRAKPLGFGSVRIITEAVSLREINAETGSWQINRIELEPFSTGISKEEGTEAMKTMRIMADWKNRPDNVRYPLVKIVAGAEKIKKNAAASHQWFTANKGKISKPNFFKVLPEAEEDANKDLEQSKALYTLIKKEKPQQR